MNADQFELTGVLVEDPHDKGFTAFFAQLPNIIAEGDSEDEAIENLKQTVKSVWKHQMNNSIPDASCATPTVKTRPVTLSFA